MRPIRTSSVGAALRTEAGTVHAGATSRTPPIPEGWCAETSAIAAHDRGRRPADRADRRDVRRRRPHRRPAGRRPAAAAASASPSSPARTRRSTSATRTAPARPFLMRELLPAAFALETRPMTVDRRGSRRHRSALTATPPYDVGIVLGSGLGGLADHVEDAVRIPYADAARASRSRRRHRPSRNVVIAGTLDGRRRCRALRPRALSTSTATPPSCATPIGLA